MVYNIKKNNFLILNRMQTNFIRTKIIFNKIY